MKYKINKKLILEYTDATGKQHSGLDIKIPKSLAKKSDDESNKSNTLWINPLIPVSALGAAGVFLASQ